MSPKFKLTALALATAMAVGASGVSNAVTITNADGVFTWTGFDWSQEGAGWIVDYGVTSASPAGTVDAFTLYFHATATALKDGSGANFTPPNMRPNDAPGLPNQYEYSIFATIQETATCIDSIGPGTCDLVLFSVTGGTYDIYYDTTADANYATGLGFTDGDHLLGGSIINATPVVAPQGPTNPGNASVAPSITGNVTFQNNLFIQPNVNFTQATTTLQFGTSITQPWTRPAAFDGLGATGPDSNTSFVGQADANQTFIAVPEPASLALLGLGLAAMGFSSRRKA